MKILLFLILYMTFNNSHAIERCHGIRKNYSTVAYISITKEECFTKNISALKNKLHYSDIIILRWLDRPDASVTETIGELAPIEEACKTKPTPKCSQSGFQLCQNLNLSEMLSKSGGKSLPYKVNGKIEGYRLVETPDCGIFEAAGFQQCDVLLNIDGKKVNSGLSLMEIINSVAKSQPQKVEVLRNNQKMIIQPK
jgi:hypothetical protein